MFFLKSVICNTYARSNYHVFNMHMNMYVDMYELLHLRPALNIIK